MGKSIATVSYTHLDVYKRQEYIRSEDIEDIKEEVIEVATNEARKEVIRLLGGVISGMNVGQPVIMQAANSEAQEPTEDVMDDADVAGLASFLKFLPCSMNFIRIVSQ